MKTRWISCAAVSILLVCIVMIPGTASTDEDQVAHPSCFYCGMDRTRFAHSRAFVTYDDGTAMGTCSLHCAAIDLSLKIDKTPVSIRVADYTTRQLIDAETAHWVTGGDQAGVMTRRAKWAFASEADALGFVSAHGGSVGEFEMAIRATFADMYADLQMIRDKRKKMRAMKSK